MDLLSIVSNLSSFATLHSWFTSQIEKKNENLSSENLNKIDVEMKQMIDSCFNQKEDVQILDEFITNHSYNFKRYGTENLFSNSEKDKVIQEFIRKNPRINKELIESILNQYFVKLNNYLNDNISLESKMLKRWIEKSKNEVIAVLEEKIPVKKFSQNNEYSQRIIELGNLIHLEVLRSDFQLSIFNRNFPIDYLVGNNLKDIFFKIEKYLNSINIKEINEKTCWETNLAMESLLNFITYISEDMSIEVRDLYSKKIRKIIVCIEEYDGKTNEYYMSLGALGLMDNNSDERIFEVVMNNLIEFLFKVYEILKYCLKEKDYKSIENKTVKNIHLHTYNKIRHYFTNETRTILREILEHGEINDVKLAEAIGIKIFELRRILKASTRELVAYKFVDNFSTNLQIKYQYIETIHVYYQQLFEGLEE